MPETTTPYLPYPLGYYVSHEAWYADSVHRKGDKPEIMVGAYADEGGCAWEFGIREYDLSGPTLRVEMFGDSWDAWAQCPELFTALREEKPQTLNAAKAILDRLGAVDKTPRETPERYRKQAPEQRAWDVIAEIRDASPRVADDASTEEIVEALVKAGLLRGDV